MVLIGSGCTARVRVPAAPLNPESVWLLQFAYHSGLAMADGPGQLVVYEFGEWGWYAENDTRWYRMFDVFLWPSRGTLARRRLSVNDPVDIDRLRWLFFADRVWTLHVESARVAALRERLHRAYEQRQDSEYYDQQLDTYFVYAEQSYHAFRTCNDVMIQWLEALDMDVSAFFWTTKWQVAGAAAATPAAAP